MVIKDKRTTLKQIHIYVKTQTRKHIRVKSAFSPAYTYDQLTNHLVRLITFLTNSTSILMSYCTGIS